MTDKIKKVNEALMGKRKVYFGVFEIIVGVALECTKGLSPTMSGFLLGIGALVIGSNLVAKTKKFRRLG